LLVEPWPGGRREAVMRVERFAEAIPVDADGVSELGLFGVVRGVGYVTWTVMSS